MNLLQIIFKQMRQRALSTWLTLLSVLLGVALATAILLFQREGARLFGQTDFGYDILIGPKGSKLQLVLNTAYHLDVSAGHIPYSFYESFPANLPPQFHGAVQWKLPIAVGDNYRGHQIVGTLPSILGVDEDGRPLPPDRIPEYRASRHFELFSGRVFHPRKFEAVIGSDVAQRTGLKLGDSFKGEHGSGEVRDEEHAERWQVVGILKPTNTANDRAIFAPLIPFLAIGAHSEALSDIAHLNAPATSTAPAEPHGHTENPDGTINFLLPQDEWRISAMLVRCPSGSVLAPGILWAVNNGNVAMAVNPAIEMRDFFQTFLKGSSDLLLLVSFLVTIVAAVSILVSIYNSVAARRKEIAILRALGATRARILSIICLEAALIGLLGGLAGIVLGHILGAGSSLYLKSLLGEGIDWFSIGPGEFMYLAAVLILAALAGLVPAAKAYQTPVATHLLS